MQSQVTELNELKLVGLTARTNNKNEMNPETSKIAEMAGNYWGNQIAQGFQHRTQPGVTYAVYTEFESDENGDYTYFIGEMVDSFEGQDLEQFETLTIAPSEYQRFTTEPGTMPDVVINAWQQIWKMQPADFAKPRKYMADFEVYDQRAANPEQAVIDIYIGIA